FTYVSEDGTITVVDYTAYETLTSLIENADGTITYTDENGANTVINVAGIVNNYQTVTPLIDNGDGTYTYTDETGAAVVIDTNTTVISDNGDGSYTLTSSNGNIITVNTSANSNPYDNTASGLASENVQDALDELSDSLEAGAGVTLEDNTDGT